jgi:hypothetical protein
MKRSSPRVSALISAAIPLLWMCCSGMPAGAQTNAPEAAAPEPVLIVNEGSAQESASVTNPPTAAPAGETDAAKRDVIGVVSPSTAAASGVTVTGDDLINVSVDNESLENVVNMFTRISGANIIATSADLKATVTVNLSGVEWRPALSAILDLHNMALVERLPGSGVLTVVPKPAGQQEALVVETIFFSYTTVPEMMPIINSMLSVVTNASISSFPSRNALVIKTTEANLREVKSIIAKMDVPGKQVCVETQFLELSDEASKKLGLRWDSLDEFGVRLNAGPFDYQRRPHQEQHQQDLRLSANRHQQFGHRRYGERFQALLRHQRGAHHPTDDDVLGLERGRH